MTTNRNDTVNLAWGNTLEVLSRASRRNRFFLLRLISLTLIFSLLTLGTLRPTLGQEARKDGPDNTPIVTASVISDGVRIAAPSAVAQLRLEVYDETGQKLRDTKQSGGNLLDWHFQENARERIADGTYLLVVTVQNPGGQLSQKLGLVTVSGQSTTLRSAGVTELSPQQVQALGPIDGEAESLAVVSAENPTPVAVLAHTGDEAQVTRSRGAVTFRSGDFFSGKDKEQMRLTEDGRLGIGTDNPRSTLDVAGTIRAERFVLAKPGKANEMPADTAEGTNAVPAESLVAGSGSQDRIAKWTDNAGTLGDSGISETAAGLVGIGTTSPSAKLTVSANTAIPPTAPLGVVAHFVNADGNNTFMTADAYGTVFHSDFLFRKARGTMAAPTAVLADDIIGQIQARGYGATGFATSSRSGIRMLAGENWTDSAQGSYLSFLTTPNASTSLAERMRITPSGNVGIGTTNPSAKLEVAGNLKLSGANGSLTFPDGTSMTTAAGGTASGTSIVNAVNDPATTGTINDSRLSPNLARLNTANTFGASQTVNGNVTATGRVESIAGGFKFPDGSVQSTAATGTKAFTTFAFNSIEIGAPGSFGQVLQLDLPAGSYMVTASLMFENRGIFNKRLVECQVVNEALWFARIEGQGGAMDHMPVTIHTVTQGGTIRVHCGALDGGTGHSNIFLGARRLTAIKLDTLVTQ